MDRRTRHQERLASWRARHPGSAHRYLELEALEELKATNDALAQRDMRERPEVCASYPSFLTIANTHKCNLTCQMCFKQLDDADNMSLPELGLEAFEALAHELFPHVRSVALSVSGEPLVSKSLFDELDLLATYGVRAAVTTNGMPLHRPGLFERLLPALHTLTVSMDGASEPVFNIIRRGASFARVVANIHRFNELRDALPEGEWRPRLHFGHILQWKNVTELPRLIELAQELRVDRVHVDHVYIHSSLNREDSLEGHKRLTNEMLERAAETAARLGVALRLPAPFTLDGEADQPYAPYDAATLLRQGRERLKTMPFDPARHEPLLTDPVLAILRETEQAGGGNAQFVERLLGRGLLNTHLEWGVPQLGPALIPREMEKVSACLYPWRESYVEYNRIVAPCCNPAFGAGRMMGTFEPGRPFREVWNNAAYRELRRSLASGRSYGFCRFCYVVESADQAAWGTHETRFKLGCELEREPRLVGQVPAGKRGVITALESGSVPAGTRLEIGDPETLLRVIEAAHEPGSDGPTFRRTLQPPLVVEGPCDVWMRCDSERPVRVELIGFTE
jgi:MoaA/NifB/PqqE/SkfB family radical SAM enzyme